MGTRYQNQNICAGTGEVIEKVFLSAATLLVVPSNLVQHWVFQVNTRSKEFSHHQDISHYQEVSHYLRHCRDILHYLWYFLERSHSLTHHQEVLHNLTYSTCGGKYCAMINSPLVSTVLMHQVGKGLAQPQT